MLIRPANPARDAEAIANIYAPYVADTVISFEYVPPTAAEMAARIERLTETHAWLVAEDAGEVLGYAYGCPHRERAAYRWATEVSVYVDPRHQRRGAGRRLYESLFGDSPGGATGSRSRGSRSRTTERGTPRGVRVRARRRLSGIGFKLEAGGTSGGGSSTSPARRRRPGTAAIHPLSRAGSESFSGAVRKFCAAPGIRQ